MTQNAYKFILRVKHLFEDFIINSQIQTTTRRKITLISVTKGIVFIIKKSLKTVIGKSKKHVFFRFCLSLDEKHINTQKEDLCLWINQNYPSIINSLKKKQVFSSRLPVTFHQLKV